MVVKRKLLPGGKIRTRRLRDPLQPPGSVSHSGRLRGVKAPQELVAQRHQSPLEIRRTLLREIQKRKDMAHMLCTMGTEPGLTLQCQLDADPPTVFAVGPPDQETRAFEPPA
jgi:hypothetical protein